jgi:arylsulfatase A-like enzyme
MNKLTRREFLKLSTATSLGFGASKLHLMPNRAQAQQEQPNILIIVFDAWSAKNVSLYGYSRDTTPQINQLAEKAIVYHNHQASGRYTTPGTASILTWMQPLTHRDTRLYDLVDERLADRNLFQVLSNSYRMAYTHNPVADVFLSQFLKWINEPLPKEALYLTHDYLLKTFFNRDPDISTVALERTLKFHKEKNASYSLLSRDFYNFLQDKRFEDELNAVLSSFPKGIPKHEAGHFFILEDAVDWLIKNLPIASSPFLSYFHFLPPHDPYKSRKEFQGYFDGDDYESLQKPIHPIYPSGAGEGHLTSQRKKYDEFILYLDAEFDRLYRALEANGILENTYLVLTSDHGEVFERGKVGHTIGTLFDPILHVPLLIFPPGQKERIDIYDRTSAVDLLPTICELAGTPIPAWAEGQVLPVIAQNASEPAKDRSIFSIDYKKVSKRGKPTQGAVAHFLGDFKLVYYFGYERYDDEFELYHLKEDPEELNDLSDAMPELAQKMLTIIKENMEAAQQKFLENG